MAAAGVECAVFQARCADVASAVQIKVLGTFAVRRDGRELALPPSRKTRALLAYLAVTGRPQRRERLCEMFWDIPDDPRGSLRWSLSKLRTLLNHDATIVTADRSVVAIDPAAVELDYEPLRDLHPDGLAGLATERLETIVAAFDGSFLADLQLPRCPEFDAWRTACANETEMLRLKVLRALVDRLDAAPDRALAHLQTLQGLCPEEDLGAEIEALIDRARAGVTRPAEATPAPATAAQGAATAKDRQQVIRFCRSRDGARIAYAVCGEGPAIVRTGHWMSHLEFDWESPVWGHWINALSQGFQLVRYDERLNGLSDPSVADLSMDALVADLESVVDAAGLQRFVLLGVSQGCAISIRYAVLHPERVIGMVLYGGYLRGWRARGDPSEIARREAMAVLTREGWGRDDPTFRQLFTSLFIPGAGRQQMDSYNELQRRTATPENAYRLNQAFADVDVSDVVDQVRRPTLVLHARDDQIVPFASGVSIAERIPGARFVELDSANHILLADEPAFRRFVEETTSFARDMTAADDAERVATRTWHRATVLCADFVSPMQTLADLDPEAALDVVDPVLLQAAALVRASGGSVADLTDARITASFGADGALDDHATVACRTALRMRELVSASADSMIRARIAIDTGDVIITPARIAQGGVEVRGAPVSIVHALNGALRRDVIVATVRVRDEAGNAVALSPLPATDVSGFPRAQALFEVLDA